MTCQKCKHYAKFEKHTCNSENKCSRLWWLWYDINTNGAEECPEFEQKDEAKKVEEI